MDDASIPAHPPGHLHPAVAAHSRRAPWSYAAELTSRAAFREVLASYCAVMIQPSANAWPADKFFGQKLRYLVSFALIGLDARWRRGSEEAPTLAALQRAAPASDRQVASLVATLKLGGYVVADPLPKDGRASRLRPSMALLKEIGRSPLAFLQASERLDPTPLPIAARLCNDELGLGDWLGGSYDMFLQEDVYFAPFANIVHFTSQDCGYPVLSAVLCAHYAELAGVAAPTILSYGGLAERFRVSRQHIGNILAGAEHRGCFAVDRGGRRVTISPEFLCEYESWAAVQIALYRLLAEGILDKTRQGQPTRGRPPDPSLALSTSVLRL